MSLIYMVLLFEAIACEACDVRPGPVKSIWNHQGHQHTHPSTRGPKAQEERCHPLTLSPTHPNPKHSETCQEGIQLKAIGMVTWVSLDMSK